MLLCECNFPQRTVLFPLDSGMRRASHQWWVRIAAVIGRDGTRAVLPNRHIAPRYQFAARGDSGREVEVRASVGFRA
jgi:hypothetical protein